MLAELRLDPLQCFTEAIPAAFVASTGKRRSEDATANNILELVRIVREERAAVEEPEDDVPQVTGGGVL